MSGKRKRNEIYKCDLCGNVIEILTGQDGSLICCGEVMKLQSEKTEDSKAEKHVPIVNEKGLSSTVLVGEKTHPMDSDHYIEWIEIINGDYVNRKYLKPGDEPEAEFYVTNKPEMIVRSYCNLHGLWKNK